MKNKDIKLKIRRTTGNCYLIESIDGAAYVTLHNPPRCSSRDHVYLVQDTIVQSEADAIGREYALLTLA